ncbi:reverse transcriptase domain-containing protein [Tanacetum coccineum]
MRTRSSSNFVVESSTIPKRRNRRRSKQIVKPELRTIVETLVATMADMRTMSELLQTPTEGYGDAIVLPAILAQNFELKVGLLQLVTSSQFLGFERDDPHAHISVGGNLLNRTPRDALTIIENKSKVRTSRNKPIVSKVSTTTSSSPSPDVTALTEIVKELVLMNKANQQASVKAVEETCVTYGGPHPYYECRATDSNTFNAYAATGTYNQGGNGYRPQGDPNYHARNQMGPPSFPPSNVQNNQNYNRYNQNQALNNQGRGQNFNQGNNNYQALNFQAPNYQAPVGPSNELTNCMKINEATLRAMQIQMTNMKTELWNGFKSFLDTRTNKIENQNTQMMNMLTNITMQKQSPSGSGSLPSNTIANLRGDVKAITTRSGVSYDGPTIPPTPTPLPKEVERETEVIKNKVQTTNLGSTAHVQPPVVQVPIPEPKVAPKPKPKPLIPYPSRLNDQKLHEKANNQMLKFLQIFQRLHFDISFADALLHMPKFASTFKSLLSNKEKVFELASTSLNENCSEVLLKKLPKKLRDLGKFLIPCDFSKLDKCLALADLGASINLMPLSVWKKLSLPELTPTRMTLELANLSVSYPEGVAEDVFVKVGKFYFPANFVVVDYDVDPRVPLILESFFLRTLRALIDVHGEELTLRVNDEAITFKVRHTSRYSHNYYDEIVHQVNVIDIACEKYAQEEIDDAAFDPEGDIRLLEKLLNNDPSSPLPSKELNFEELKMIESSINDPSELELKDLPSHLEYALEGTDKLPVIISKELKDEEKAALLKVLKSHKRAIAWKISNIKGINPRFCTHKISMKDDFKPAVQHQRRVNPKILEVIKKEVIKLLDAGLIYPIFDSLWVSPVHCVPKKGGMTVVENEDNELIPTRHVLKVHDGHFPRHDRGNDGAFNILKKKLTEAPILVAPDWDLPFEIMYDASDFVVGVVLGQRKTKHFQPIHYASKTMMDAQAHYTTTEKELLTVVYAFEKFWPYLVLSKTIMYTDHSALKYLLAKQDAKPRLLR